MKNYVFYFGVFYLFNGAIYSTEYPENLGAVIPVSSLSSLLSPADLTKSIQALCEDPVTKQEARLLMQQNWKINTPYWQEKEKVMQNRKNKQGIFVKKTLKVERYYPPNISIKYSDTAKIIGFSFSKIFPKHNPNNPQEARFRFKITTWGAFDALEKLMFSMNMAEHHLGRKNKEKCHNLSLRSLPLYHYKSLRPTPQLFSSLYTVGLLPLQVTNFFLQSIDEFPFEQSLYVETLFDQLMCTKLSTDLYIDTVRQQLTLIYPSSKYQSIIENLLGKISFLKDFLQSETSYKATPIFQEIYKKLDQMITSKAAS